jgi:hypothetical protein
MEKLVRSGLVAGLEAVSEFGVHDEVENRGSYKLCSGTVFVGISGISILLTPSYRMKDASQQVSSPSWCLDQGLRADGG